ncbi:MAG: ABC transporter permease [Actinomycetota bacterium]
MRSKIPRSLLILAIAGVVVFLLLPLAGLVQRAPWRHIGSNVASHQVLAALRLSLITSFSAAAIAGVFGVPLAYILARGIFRGRAILRALITLPMVLPPVVGGVALLLAFGRRGLIGQWLDRWFGIRLPFTIGAAIAAEAFVALPFLVLSVEGALRTLDPSYEETAATLGASPLSVFRRITLPMIAPSIAAGFALAWARALGEFGATITFAGSFPGKTQTVPLAVYDALESNPSAAIALSLVLLAVSLLVLIVLGSRRLSNPFRTT